MAYNALQGTFEKIMQKNLVKCLHISKRCYNFAIERFTGCEHLTDKAPLSLKASGERRQLKPIVVWQLPSTLTKRK